MKYRSGIRRKHKMIKRGDAERVLAVKAVVMAAEEVGGVGGSAVEGVGRGDDEGGEDEGVVEDAGGEEEEPALLELVQQLVRVVRGLGGAAQCGPRAWSVAWR